MNSSKIVGSQIKNIGFDFIIERQYETFAIMWDAGWLHVERRGIELLPQYKFSA